MRDRGSQRRDVLNRARKDVLVGRAGQPLVDHLPNAAAALSETRNDVRPMFSSVKKGNANGFTP